MNRGVALRTLALGTLAATARPAYAQSQRVTLRIGTAPVESYAAPFYAKQNGFFDRAGIDAQISVFPGGGAVLAALLGGSLDLGMTNSGAMANAHARNVPLALFFPGGYYTSAHPTTALLVSKTSPLRTAKDFTGKTIALTTLRDLVQVSTMKWMDENGGDASSIKWIEMPTAEMAPALVAGRIDGAVVVEPEITENKATTRIFAKNYDAVAKTLMISGWVGTTDWLDKNLATARRVVDVMRQTADWANRNQRLIAPILQKYTKVPADVIVTEQHVVWGTRLDPKVIQPIIDTSARYKILPQAFPAADMFYAPLARS